MTMAARWIVERVNVVRYLDPCKLAGSVDLLLDAFHFQTAEELFRDRVVPAVSATAHARFKMICFAESPPIVAAILRTLVGMNDRSAWSSAPYRHQNGVEYELAGYCRSRRPPNDLSGEQIHDR